MAESWPTETVRNSPFLKLAQKIPPPQPPLKKEKPGSGAPRKKRKELGRMRFAPFPRLLINFIKKV